MASAGAAVVGAFRSDGCRSRRGIHRFPRSMACQSFRGPGRGGPRFPGIGGHGRWRSSSRRPRGGRFGRGRIRGIACRWRARRGRSGATLLCRRPGRRRGPRAAASSPRDPGHRPEVVGDVPAHVVERVRLLDQGVMQPWRELVRGSGPVRHASCSSQSGRMVQSSLVEAQAVRAQVRLDPGKPVLWGVSGVCASRGDRGGPALVIREPGEVVAGALPALDVAGCGTGLPGGLPPAGV